MNLIELRDRLSEIIEQNNSRFPTENRNLSTVYIKNQVSKRITEFLPSAKYMSSSIYTFTDNQTGFIIDTDCTNKLTYGKNRKSGK